MRTYTVIVTLTVHPDTDTHLQTKRAIRDEFRSWLEGLDAKVHHVHVTVEEARDK